MQIGDLMLSVPSIMSFVVALIAVICIALFAVHRMNSFGLLFGHMYEGMYDFFADILGEEEFTWIKSFITSLFFVVLIYNLMGLTIDFFGAIWGYDETGTLNISEYISSATSDINFNIAIAVVGVLLSLGIQFFVMDGDGFLGKKISEKKRNSPFFKTLNFVYEYVPFWGKDIITVERGDKNVVVYSLLWIFVKAFDLLISLFVGFLDIIGVIAKVVSLAFRLFGNMLSGSALMGVLILGTSAMTNSLLGFDFPILAPLILLLQGLLVAGIQAFVFPLLIAIYIKVARMSTEEEDATA